jgi:peptidoglycan biosynthesis protein MviN/MurJ (putative lipid II flippase)
LGILGLAVSESLGNVIQCFGLLYFFVRAVDGGGWGSTAYKFLKIFIASIIFASSTWLAIKFLDLFVLDTTKTLSLSILFVLSSLFGFICYLLSAKFLNVEEFKEYGRLVTRFKATFIRK